MVEASLNHGRLLHGWLLGNLQARSRVDEAKLAVVEQRGGGA